MQNREEKERGELIKTQIQFIPGFEEMTIPSRVKLTKSENGETGTATFIFFEPTVFSLIGNINLTGFSVIGGMDLLWDKKKITSKDIKVYFRNGKPTIIRSILIFRNSKDWFNFLNFMNSYSKETGLSFTEFK